MGCKIVSVCSENRLKPGLRKFNLFPPRYPKRRLSLVTSEGNFIQIYESPTPVLLNLAVRICDQFYFRRTKPTPNEVMTSLEAH